MRLAPAGVVFDSDTVAGVDASICTRATAIIFVEDRPAFNVGRDAVSGAHRTAAISAYASAEAAPVYWQSRGPRLGLLLLIDRAPNDWRSMALSRRTFLSGAGTVPLAVATLAAAKSRCALLPC